MTAALNRFISRSADRCKPFFSLINKWKDFEWNEECASAFQQLKDYLSQPSIMSSPEPDEVLFAYIAVVPHVVSLVLIRVDQGVQRPVYYVSKSLHEAEIRYLPLERAILAVVLGTRKLPHYFQAYTVVVLTQLPLKIVLRSADYTGRIAKWGTILGAFDIRYMPRTSVKGQVLADLVAEFTEPSMEDVAVTPSMDEKSVGMVSQQDPAHWELYVDGAANRKGSEVGLVLTSPEGIIIEKSLRLPFNDDDANESLDLRRQRIGHRVFHEFGSLTFLASTSFATTSTPSPAIFCSFDLDTRTRAHRLSITALRCSLQPGYPPTAPPGFNRRRSRELDLRYLLAELLRLFQQR
nr:retrovirus-related pol polyprotein from transposon 17.6 [Quercus suber]